MFTGIIQAVGSIAQIIQHAEDRTLICKAPPSFLSGIGLGDSIAVSGACLTAVSSTEDTFSVDLSAETLACTYFSKLSSGDPVNLEKALTLQTPLNGHWVTGHVDGVGIIRAEKSRGRSKTFEIEIAKKWMRYMAEKGSVCLDGVSLTIQELADCGIMVTCIPQTLAQTTLGAWQVGNKAHIEVDLIARYVERMRCFYEHD